jgi:hypothetical protein
MAFVAEVHLMSEPRSEHLTPMDVASYIDGAATGDDRRRIDAHLADCVECRNDVVDSGRIVRSQASARLSSARLLVPTAIAAAAAAAMVLVLVRPPLVEQRGEHREAPLTTTVLPHAVAPIGTVDSVPLLQWTSVPNADQYHVRLFNADGTVLWAQTTGDTTAAMPTTVAIRPNSTYSWMVEAQTGFGRQAPSELINFSLRTPRRR